jgi:hypothetical protein
VLGSDFFNTKTIIGLFIGLFSLRLLVHRPYLRFLHDLNLLSHHELVDRLFKTPLKLFLRALPHVRIDILILLPCYLLLLPCKISLATELSGLAHLISLEAEADPTITHARMLMLLWRCPPVTKAHPHFLLYVAPTLLHAVLDQVFFGEQGGKVGFQGLLLGRLSCQRGRGLRGGDVVELGSHKLRLLWLGGDSHLVESLV